MIERAIEVAAKAHKNQTRKCTDIPYITHPYTVGMMLLREGLSEEVVAAGILHDTVEDTSITLEFIQREFGEKVAKIVKGCSEPDKTLPWEDRKKHTIEYLKTASFEEQVVSCADKLHNITTVYEAYKEIGEEVWKRFKRGRDKQEWYYRSLVEVLCTKENLSSGIKLFSQFKNMVDKVFNK